MTVSRFPTRSWALASVLIAALLASCGGAPTLRVRSDPDGARIYVNGVEKGQTEDVVTLPFDEGPRVWVQVVHPRGRVVGLKVYTVEELPESGEDFFSLN